MVTLAAVIAAGVVNAAKFEWKLAPDRVDGLYKSGETVKFTFSGKLDGAPIPEGTRFACGWRCGNERGEKFELVMKSDTLTIERPVTETCYYSLSMMPLDADGKPATKEWLGAGCTVLCNMDQVKLPEEAVPADFDAWWDAEVAAQKKIPMEVKRTVRGLYDGADEARKKVIASRQWMIDNYNRCNCYDVRIKAAGENWTAGGLVIPKKEGKFPAIIQFYGVGWDGVCMIDTMQAVNNNAIVFHVNCHGLPDGTNWEDGYQAMKKRIEDYAATKSEWMKYYPKIGMGEGRDNWYFRYVYLRAARAVEYIKTLPEWDGKTIIVRGASQGSAQSIAAAALAEGVTHMYIGISAVADLSGSKSKPKRRCGWPFNVRSDAPYPEAGYFDTVNFVHRLHGKKIFLCFGLSDGLVQPCGPAAIWNSIPADNEKELLVEACRGHDGPWCQGEFQKRIAPVCRGK